MRGFEATIDVEDTTPWFARLWSRSAQASSEKLNSRRSWTKARSKRLIALQVALRPTCWWRNEVKRWKWKASAWQAKSSCWRSCCVVLQEATRSYKKLQEAEELQEVTEQNRTLMKLLRGTTWCACARMFKCATWWWQCVWRSSTQVKAATGKAAANVPAADIMAVLLTKVVCNVYIKTRGLAHSFESKG